MSEARVLAEHYGMPVRVISLACLVRQFPDSPLAGVAKEIEEGHPGTLDALAWRP
jgi:hypothetical protein